MDGSRETQVSSKNPGEGVGQFGTGFMQNARDLAFPDRPVDVQFILEKRRLDAYRNLIRCIADGRMYNAEGNYLLQCRGQI